MNACNMEARPTKFGQKHKEIMSSQIGRESPYVDALIAIGRWYIIQKPEHIQNPMIDGDVPGNFLDFMAYSEMMFGSVEPPYFNCVLCGAENKYQDSHLTLAPLPCYSCMTIGWVYSPEVDAMQNWGLFCEMIEQMKPLNADDAWGTYGIPREVYFG